VRDTTELARDLLPAAFGLSHLDAFLQLLRCHGFRYFIISTLFGAADADKAVYLVQHPDFVRREPFRLSRINKLRQSSAPPTFASQIQPEPKIAPVNDALVNALAACEEIKMIHSRYKMQHNAQVHAIFNLIHGSILPTLKWMQAISIAIQQEMDEQRQKLNHGFSYADDDMITDEMNDEHSSN
jgi:hypothetical protein